MPVGSKTILITGGTGYLGQHLVRKFQSEGAKVVILSRRSELPQSLMDLKKNVQVLTLSELKKSEQKIDILLHAATCYGRNGESREELLSANVHYPLDIIQTIVHSKLRFFNIDTALPEKINPYAQTKKDFIEKLREDFPKLKTINIVLDQFFGPGDKSFVSWVIKALKAKKPSLDLTHGGQRRDFLFIADLVDAIFLLVSDYESQEVFEDFPVGSGALRSIKSIVEAVAAQIPDHQTQLQFGAVPMRENEMMETTLDISKISKLGWYPEYDFELALEKMIKED